MTLYSENFKSIKEMLEALQKLSNETPYKGFDALKYAGKVKCDIDPLVYQKQMRDEWN